MRAQRRTKKEARAQWRSKRKRGLKGALEKGSEGSKACSKGKRGLKGAEREVRAQRRSKGSEGSKVT
jgi:hypothetical protein